MYKLQDQDLHCGGDQRKHERRHDKFLSCIELAWAAIGQIWMQAGGLFCCLILTSYICLTSLLRFLLWVMQKSRDFGGTTHLSSFER